MLSERLKEIRKELRLTQDEFANSLGLKIRILKKLHKKTTRYRWFGYITRLFMNSFCNTNGLFAV